MKAPPEPNKSLVWAMLQATTYVAIIVSFLVKNHVQQVPSPLDITLHIVYFSIAVLFFYRSLNALIFHIAVLLFAMGLYVIFIARDLVVRFYDYSSHSGQIYVDSAGEDAMLMAFYFMPNCVIGFGLSVAMFAIGYGLSGLVNEKV